MISRTVSVVFGLFLAVALVALAAPASAEMYVEGTWVERRHLMWVKPLAPMKLC